MCRRYEETDAGDRSLRARSPPSADHRPLAHRDRRGAAPADPALRATAPRRRRPDGPHAGAALRRPADRSGRLHRAALLLGGLLAGGPVGRVVRRAAGRRRGLHPPRRRGGAGRRAGGARPARGLVRLGRRHARALRRRRHRGGPVHRHDQDGARARPPRPAAGRGVRPHARGAALRRRARGRRRPDRADPGGARHPPGGAAHRSRPAAAVGAGPDRLRLRLGGFADAAGQLLLGLGMRAEDIRVEQFGPSGG